MAEFWELVGASMYVCTICYAANVCNLQLILLVGQMRWTHITRLFLMPGVLQSYYFM